MKRLILFVLILNSVLAAGQNIPPSEGPDLYGTRHFISLDGTDTLAIYHGTDTTHLVSTDSIYIHKLMNVSGSGVSDHGSLTGLDDPNDHPWALEWNDTISTIATRTWVGTNYLGITDKAADADKVDGLQASQFLRSDVSDTTTGVITIDRQGDGAQLLKFNTERYWYFQQSGTGASTKLSLVSGTDNKEFDIRYYDGTRAAVFHVGVGLGWVALAPDAASNVYLVNGGGNVGINELSPTEKLHVNGNGLFEGKLGIGTPPTYKFHLVETGNDNEVAALIDTEYYGMLIRSQQNTYPYYLFRVANSDGTIFNVGANGNVGINVTNPTEKLHVNGNILASGEVTADNINTTVQSLSGTTVIWNVSSGHNATITLSGNTTITMSNLVAGTTGNLTVTNPSTAYTITFSGYTFLISPILGSSGDTITMSGNSEKDVLSWYYDGTQVFINGTFSYE